jgi:hypothetical protein
LTSTHSGSYATNFTRIGNAILVTMDFADIILAARRSLRIVVSSD